MNWPSHITRTGSRPAGISTTGIGPCNQRESELAAMAFLWLHQVSHVGDADPTMSELGSQYIFGVRAYKETMIWMIPLTPSQYILKLDNNQEKISL